MITFQQTERNAPSPQLAARALLCALLSWVCFQVRELGPAALQLVERIHQNSFRVLRFSETLQLRRICPFNSPFVNVKLKYNTNYIKAIYGY